MVAADHLRRIDLIIDSGSRAQHLVYRLTIILSCCVIGAVLASAPRVATAQVPPLDDIERKLPPDVRSRQVEERFRLPAEPRPAPELVIPDDGVESGLGRVTGVRLLLEGVRVEGATAYEADDFTDLYEGYLGKRISLADIYRIVNAITARYRNDGYILSRAILPPQRISDGNVRIDVVEGWIDRVRFEGEVRRDKSLLKAYASRITDSRPLRARVLERYLLLLRDLPGLDSQAVLTSAKDQPGASDLIIRLRESAGDGFLRVDNRGTEFNGPVQLWSGIGINAPFGASDRSTLRFVTTSDTEELRYVEVGHERQVGTEGTRLSFFAARTGSQPSLGGFLKSVKVKSRNDVLRIGVNHPLVRSRADDLLLSGELVARNAETTVLRDQLSADKLRFVSLHALYRSADRLGGINQTVLNLDQGLDIFDGPENKSRENSKNDFTKFRLDLLRTQRISERWSLLGTVSSQYVLSKVPASAEFGVGGEACGRGYDPSELAGDHGACALTELRFGDDIHMGVPAEYQLYGFWDVGGVWREPPTGGLEKRSSLASAGLGVRFNLSDNFSGSLEVAWPLTRSLGADGSDDARGFASGTLRF